MAITCKTGTTESMEAKQNWADGDAGSAGADIPGRKIRVAHLLHTMAYGGIETALLNWLKALNREEFEVSLICFANPDQSETPFMEVAANRGWTVQTIPWNRSKPLLQAAWKLRRILLDEGISVLHSHNTYANLTALLAAKICPSTQRPKVITTLYVWGSFGFVRNALQWIDLKILPWFDEVSAHCEETFRATVARGYPKEKLKLLTCGYEAAPVMLSPTNREAERAALGVRPGDVVLINVARFWPEKAHDMLLEAFAALLKKHPRTHLWLLGTGPIEDQIKAQAARMKFDERLCFLGFRKDLEHWLALADIQVHPSDNEGVPLAVCAGLAAGLPVVATDVGGLAEIIRPGGGVLIPPRCPDLLVEALGRLIEDPSCRQEIAAAGQQFIEGEYSLRSAAERVAAVYREMAK